MDIRFSKSGQRRLFISDYSVTAPYGGYEINSASTIREDSARFGGAEAGFTGDYAFKKSFVIFFGGYSVTELVGGGL